VNLTLSIIHLTAFIPSTTSNRSISTQAHRIRLDRRPLIPRSLTSFRRLAVARREFMFFTPLLLERLNPKAMVSFSMPPWLSSQVAGKQSQDQTRDDHNHVDIYHRKSLPSARRNFLRRVSFRQSEAHTKSPRGLLDVLTLEIRQNIWEDVLGYHSFHLNIKFQAYRFTGLLCLSPDPNTCRRGRDGCRVRLSDEQSESERNMLLPILLVCKQM
jgi:hypothetical protein